MKPGSPQVLKEWTKMREADFQNTNYSTSCTTHVIVPTQVHSFIFFLNTLDISSLSSSFNILPAPRLSPGEVLASTIVHYLHSMTAQSPGQDQLVSLGRLLDPECQDRHVSRETFHACITEWISQCSQERWRWCPSHPTWLQPHDSAAQTLELNYRNLQLNMLPKHNGFSVFNLTFQIFQSSLWLDYILYRCYFSIFSICVSALL